MTRAPSPSADTAVPLPALVTGANLRAVGDEQRGYGTRTARATMERLARLGVNTIAVLLEGRLAHRDATEITTGPTAELEAIRSALADAQALGFATVLIPHLVLDDGDWRGYIEHRDPGAREAWWTSYFGFIDVAAGIAASSGTTVLSIGVELKGLSGDQETRARMHQLAARVRRDYRGLLTYSANWDEAEGVAFWDAVDLAGVNGYYPLVPDPPRGAEAVARRLSSLAELSGREVLVLEVGYRASPASFERPWEWPEDVPEVVDEASQATAWASVLTHWLATPRVRGLLVWVIPTDPDDPASEPRHGFCPLNKLAEQVIGSAFDDAHRARAAGAHPSAAGATGTAGQ